MEPDQLIIRSFSQQKDIPAALRLYEAVEAADHNGMDVSEQALRSQLGLAGQDTSKDRWVVESAVDPGPLLASALISLPSEPGIADANIVVHPQWRQRGIGGELLSRVIQRAEECMATGVQIYAGAGHPTAPAFLHKRGFAPQGAYTELRLADGVRLPPAIWPFGYTMQPYSAVQNLATLTEAMNLSYIPLWGHHEVSQEPMASWLPDFDPQGLFLVFSEKGRAVGISRVEPSRERSQKNGAPTGYIDAPGVVPQHRRLDLYRALVLTGIRWLQERGQVVIEMESWGDKLEVLKMYRELGFRDVRQLVCYQKAITLAGGVKDEAVSD